MDGVDRLVERQRTERKMRRLSDRAIAVKNELEVNILLLSLRALVFCCPD